jgi:sugar lactone lactonase YvrE
MARQTRTLVEGVYFGEGPRWRDGRLWFSDFHAHAVKSVSPAGDLRTEVELDDQPSGLGWTPEGSLLIVSMIKRQLLRRSSDGRLDVHADLGGVADFHCNDMVVDGSGRAYVGNFGFDLSAAMATGGPGAAMADPKTARLALVLPDGQVRVAASDLHFPNGTVITPDGSTLIIAETMAARLTAFDIGPDGALSNRRVWAETGGRPPDGIALDAAGAVWVANPMGAECVRIAEGGEVLETIDTGQACYACMLGGEDGRTLFMLTAPALGEDPAAAPRGKVITATVDVGRAGLP